jgi:hypothetical protein
MDNFIQKQIDASERLYNMMLSDHKMRFEKIAETSNLSESLQKNLHDRDKTIADLRAKLMAYEVAEKL